MRDLTSIPFGTAAQRQVERRRESALAAGAPAPDIRAVVRESWSRALRAQIRPQMLQAPLVWDEDALENARRRADWLPLARRVVSLHHGLYAEGGHILSLFDAAGRMLLSDGDPGALDGLKEIGFQPGGLWAEHAVGTNGPGTALATGGPVHIIGAEHFCEGWNRWHCAAVPVRDPATGDIVGAIDISGFREAAHPHTLTLAIAVATAIEQMLATRESERRVRVLGRLAEMAGRWPGDTVLAVDRRGAVVGTSSLVGAPIPALVSDPERLRTTLAEAVATTGADAGEVRLPGGIAATLLPVFDGELPVGACVVITGRAGPASAAQLAGGALRRAPAPLRRSAGDSLRYSLHDLVGQAPSLVEACRVAFVAAANTLPVLLQGESGTGKEVFAQGIHAASDRAAAPFVAVNCAALPRELIESELFGYVGGAFSGARREGSTGKFEAAHGGTIFLDEITELSPAAQATLLRVLQEGEVTRVGASRSRKVDVRVIAASNRDLDECRASGALREDLFYRLSVLTLELPPLRRRPGDVARLAEHFLAEAGRELKRSWCRFAPGVEAALQAYAWPGNVRELENLVRRLVALATGPEITAADLPLPIRQAATHAPRALGGIPEAVTIGAYEPAGDDRDALAREELRLVIEQASTMQEAAARLGVTRSTLYRRLERYGLKPARTVRR
jgi:sigma-54 dependent transcriptional regulator, acetoin dehydrogenase operon transcriptional activator AcoR